MKVVREEIPPSPEQWVAYIESLPYLVTPNIVYDFDMSSRDGSGSAKGVEWDLTSAKLELARASVDQLKREVTTINQANTALEKELKMLERRLAQLERQKEANFLQNLPILPVVLDVGTVF